MQYLLSEEEFKALSSRQSPEVSNAQKTALESCRTKILELTNSKCIHSGGVQDNRRKSPEYCDKCPVVELADSMGMGLSGRKDYLKVLCTLPKDFSK